MSMKTPFDSSATDISMKTFFSLFLQLRAFLSPAVLQLNHNIGLVLDLDDIPGQQRISIRSGFDQQVTSCHNPRRFPVVWYSW